MRTGRVLKHTIVGRDLDEVTSAIDHGFGIDWEHLQRICARTHLLTDPAKFARLLSVWRPALQVRIALSRAVGGGGATRPTCWLP